MASPQITPNQDRWGQYAETPGNQSKTGDKWDEFAEQPKSEPKSDTDVLSTLGRELKSGYQSVKSIPSSLYHAVADDTKPEEGEDYIPPMPYGTDLALKAGKRLVYDPVARASTWWYDAAKGNNPTAYEDALSVAPEAIGGGAGAVAAGEAAPKVLGGIKNVPRLAAGAIRTIPTLRAGVSGALDFASKSLDPDLVGLVSPRAAHAIRYAGKVSDAVRPGPFKYSAPAGPSMESGNFSPVEGEYLPPEAPKALSAGIRRPVADASFPAPEAKSAPYRYGPGAIEPEDVAPPDPFVLGRRQGVRVQPSGPMRSLPAAPPEAEPFGVSRSEKFEPVERPDALDDKAWQEHMRDDLANHGARARREASANFREGNDVSKPKWEMQAEAKAAVERQRILDEARRTHDNPLAGLPRVTSRTKASSGEAPVTTPDSEILSKLKESVKKAQADKKK